MGISFWKIFLFFAAILALGLLLFPSQRQLGMFYSKSRDYSEALPYLSQQYQQHPEDFLNTRRYVQALLDQGDFGAAGDIITVLEKAHGREPAVLELLADYYEGQMLYDQAGHFWSALLAAGASSPEDKEKLINYYIDYKKTAAMIVFFESAAPAEKTPDMFYYLAQIYSSRRDAAEMERIYLALLQKFPREETAKRKLADLYEASGRRQEALPFLEKLFLENPGSRDYAQRYIDALFYFNRADAVRQALNLLIHKFSASPSVLMLAARAYARAGERARALAVLADAAQLTQKDRRSWAQLGEIYFELEDFDSAKNVLEILHEKNGGTYHSHHILGDVLVAMGDGTRGRREYERALELVRE